MAGPPIRFGYYVHYHTATVYEGRRGNRHAAASGRARDLSRGARSLFPRGMTGRPVPSRTGSRSSRDVSAGRLTQFKLWYSQARHALAAGPRKGRAVLSLTSPGTPTPDPASQGAAGDPGRLPAARWRGEAERVIELTGRNRVRMEALPAAGPLAPARLGAGAARARPRRRSAPSCSPMTATRSTNGRPGAAPLQARSPRCRRTRRRRSTPGHLAALAAVADDSRPSGLRCAVARPASRRRSSPIWPQLAACPDFDAIRFWAGARWWRGSPRRSGTGRPGSMPECPVPGPTALTPGRRAAKNPCAGGRSTF